MAILSKRIIAEVSRAYYAEYGLRLGTVDLSGRIDEQKDRLSILANSRRRRSYALQQSIDLGKPYIYNAAPMVATWVVAMEDKRMIHGGLIGGEVLIDGSLDRRETREYLVTQGMSLTVVDSFLRKMLIWPESMVTEAAEALQEMFYRVSGWSPDLLKENHLKVLQQEQINRAIEDQRKHGKNVLYAFEKERILLSNIRAGDRNGARRMLNDMLAAIYLSSPKMPVLRARTVELMSCLTRAAIEDNPLMEPLIERNHIWTERLVTAVDFNDLSQSLMAALDSFIDGIYLHGMNRSNTKVRKALDYIGNNFAEKMSLQSVADNVGLSTCRLAHLVKASTGVTVHQMIQQVRIRRAQQLLERTSKSCAEIAYEVGYNDQSYFIKHFKRLTGQTPLRYRKV